MASIRFNMKYTQVENWRDMEKRDGRDRQKEFIKINVERENTTG